MQALRIKSRSHWFQVKYHNTQFATIHTIMTADQRASSLQITKQSCTDQRVNKSDLKGRLLPLEWVYFAWDTFPRICSLSHSRFLGVFITGYDSHVQRRISKDHKNKNSRQSLSLLQNSRNKPIKFNEKMRTKRLKEEENCPYFVSSEYTAEKEQEPLEVFPLRSLIENYIAVEKDKWNEKIFKHWWTADWICAINKAQRKAFKPPAVICYSTDGQEATHLGVRPRGYHGLGF